MALEKVTFEPNTPVCVRLKYPAGKIVSGQFGEQVYYSLADGRAMYLDLSVGEKVNQIAARPGEPIMILKKWSGKRTERPEWMVWKDDGSDPELVGQLAASIGQQRNGTFAVPKLPGAGAVTPAPAATLTPSRQTQPTANNGNSSTWGDDLLSEANQLVDIYAAAWKYTRERYPGEVKPEEVKSMVITAYIQRGKGAAR
jgi:hypothetical protein